MNGDQHCVIIETAYDYIYSDGFCTSIYAFLCETPALTLAEICVAPYTYDNILDICWRLEETTPLTWDAARDVCIDEGGDLMILNSIAIHDYIKDVLSLGKYGGTSVARISSGP